MSDSCVAEFKDMFPLACYSMSCPNTTVDSNHSPSKICHFEDSAASSLRMTLDSIAPLRKTSRKHKRLEENVNIPVIAESYFY